jgi:hypothetical protein
VPFLRGAYFGPKFALIGPANLLSFQPQFVFHPVQNVSGTLAWIWFWRESTKDALYSFGNVQLRRTNLTDARYVGAQPNLEIRWAISEHFLAALNLAGFLTGTFLQQSPPVEANCILERWSYLLVLTSLKVVDASSRTENFTSRVLRCSAPTYTAHCSRFASLPTLRYLE